MSESGSEDNQCNMIAESNSEEEENECHIDKQRLAKAVAKIKTLKSASAEFAWGGEITGTTKLIQTLHVEGIGDIPVPVSAQHAEQLKNLGNGLNTDTSAQSVWLIEPSQVSIPSAFNNNYFETAITPALVKLAMTQLKLPTDVIDAECHLQKILLHGSGGHLRKQKETVKETGMFGTMVLQIPVQGGYLGGDLVVEHYDVRKKLSFDTGSCDQFFLAAYFANCEHQLEHVTKGLRLTMVFHLIWKNGMPPVRNPVDVPVFLEVLKEIHESYPTFSLPTENLVQDLPTISAEATRPDTALHTPPLLMEIMDFSETNIPSSSSSTDAVEVSSQVEIGSTPPRVYAEHFNDRDMGEHLHKHLFPRPSLSAQCNFPVPYDCESDLVFFLLEHQYSKKNLSLSVLKGQDSILAKLLKSCPFLDVHLAILVRHTVKNDDYSASCHDYSDCCDDRQDPDDEDDELHVEFEHWINSNNTVLELQGLEVDYESQMIGDQSKLLKPTAPVRETKEYMQREERFLERWYDQAVLVAWPKCQTSRIYLKYNFNSVLSQLEAHIQPLELMPFSCHSLPLNKDGALEDLQKVLAFCRTDPWSVWQESPAKESQRAERLLKLCTGFEAKKEGLALLDLLGDFYSHRWQAFYEGIQDDGVAEAIAEFVCRVGGWPDCKKAIEIILSPSRIPKQMGPFIRLVHNFIDRSCLEEAKEVADWIFSHLSSSSDLVAKLDRQDIEAYLKMAIDLEESFITATSECVVSIQDFPLYLTDEQLAQLIIGFQASSRNSSRPFVTALHQSIRLEFLNHSVLHKLLDHQMVLKVLESIIPLKNDTFTHSMVEKMCASLELPHQQGWSSSIKFDLLMDIVSSADIWRELGSSKRLVLAAAFKVIENWCIETALNINIGAIGNNKRLEPPSSSYHQYGPKVKEDPLDIEIATCLKLFIAIEKMHPHAEEQPNVVQSHFLPLFKKMSIQRLYRLIKMVHSSESNPSINPNLKQCPILVSLCQTLGEEFVHRPELIAHLEDSLHQGNFAIHLFQYLFWIESSQLPFAKKVIDASTLQSSKEHFQLLITRVLSSCEIRSSLVTSGSSQNLAACKFLMDHRISHLNAVLSVPLAEFTWEQPDAVFSSCPAIETFLRSPQEQLTYCNFKNITEARDFAKTLRDGQYGGRYYVNVTERGPSRNSTCDIKKNKKGYQLAVSRVAAQKEELANLTRFYLEILQLDPKVNSRRPKEASQSEKMFEPAAKKSRTD